MDRLTWEYSEGGIYLDGTEISPSDFEGHVVYYGPAVDRLAAYEDAEEQGRCVVLPKRGDKLFYYPYPDAPNMLRNTGDGSGIVQAVRICVRFDNWAGWLSLNKTRAEAEAALKGE